MRSLDFLLALWFLVALDVLCFTNEPASTTFFSDAAIVDSDLGGPVVDGERERHILGLDLEHGKQNADDDLPGGKVARSTIRKKQSDELREWLRGLPGKCGSTRL